MSKGVYYLVHIEPQPKGGFYITVPALPECKTRARTFDRGLKKARTAIEKHLNALFEAGKPLPTESQKVRPICVPIRVYLPKRAKPVLAADLDAKR